MFFYKVLYTILIAYLALQDSTEAKKSRRNKRPNDEEDVTLQPSVVSYSTFGFNDVGSYDGFVPSSPDYANYLSNVHQEDTSTRLYAPAFPTALDSTGYDSSYASQSDGHPLGFNDEGDQQHSMPQYTPTNFFHTSSLDNNDNQNSKLSSIEIHGRHTGDGNAPVYGTKLGAKSKKPMNNSEYNIYNDGNLVNPSDISLNFNYGDEQQSTSEAKPFGESVNNNYQINSNYQNVPTSIATYPKVEAEQFVKPAQSSTNNLLKFPKVIDFTKMNYPTDVENKYSQTSYNPVKSIQNENTFKNTLKNDEDHSSNFYHHGSIFKEPMNFNSKNIEEPNVKQSSKPNFYTSPDYNNYISTPSTKNSFKNTGFKPDIKDSLKNKFTPGNYSNDFKSWRNPAKGYQYSTNYSSTSFKYDVEEPHKTVHQHFDEIIPASSNIVDLTNYQFHNNDDIFSSFKKMPEIKPVYEEEYSVGIIKDKLKTDDYINQFKHLYSGIPASTSQWGNIFKTSEYSSHKHHPKKPIHTDDTSSDIVHIPKRPNSSKYNFGKHFDSYSNINNDWSSYSKNRPHNYKSKPIKDWGKENYNPKFKTEEDLLGLRNHDTSNPSYLPTYRPSDNELSEDNNYKKLVDKWRHSYWKAKFRESYPDFESYSTETKPVHVPIPKPYPIEVPHPVIVPVPQPYPVRVPIPKPVAVPVVQELTIPIEKPMPYPVIKKVPYPVEKPVPVPVEKEVAVPVMKPYPVHIPHVRPIFHHSKPPRDEFDSDNGDEVEDYFPRPEGGKKIVSYKKRPKSTRNRQHRPTRTTYQDRNSRRRWPRRPADSSNRRPYSSHIDFRYTPSYFRDFDQEFDESNEYVTYCKRTGNC